MEYSYMLRSHENLIWKSTTYKIYPFSLFQISFCTFSTHASNFSLSTMIKTHDLTMLNLWQLLIIIILITVLTFSPFGQSNIFKTVWFIFKNYLHILKIPCFLAIMSIIRSSEFIFRRYNVKHLSCLSYCFLKDNSIRNQIW